MRDEDTSPGKLTLSPWQSDALCIAPRTALECLAGLPSEEETPPGIKVGADLRYWQVAAKFALELVVRQRLTPV